MAEKAKQIVDQMYNDGWNPEDETIYTNYLGYGVFDEPTTIRVKESQIAYVRKDAFVENVKKAMTEWAGTYVSKTTGGGVGERKALAADLLNYFKKYMEEPTTVS